LDARRPNAIAQGFYTRFFNIINSPSVSYLMACVAEVYFNHIRQTAIRSIWKAYCRTPQSQQYKNDQWTVEELTKVLHFDNDQQTIDFCNAQDLRFTENSEGGLYLDWGDRPVDSVGTFFLFIFYFKISTSSRSPCFQPTPRLNFFLIRSSKYTAHVEFLITLFSCVANNSQTLHPHLSTPSLKPTWNRNVLGAVSWLLSSE